MFADMLSDKPAKLDPYVKPKPGQKPKQATPEIAPPAVRPTSAQMQRTQQAFCPPPQEQQKLSLCRFFEEGYCQRGSSCWFAHGRDELRHPQKHTTRQQAHTFKQPVYEDDQDQEQCPDEALFKTRMCIYFLQGRCQRGSTCSFAHDPAELQAYNPARRYAQQAQAHTMDKYLPQSLQDEAAASSSAREAAAADAKPHKPQTIQHVPLPPVPTPISPVSCQPMVPKTTPAISLPSQLGQPYITPMPVNTNSLKQQATAPSQNGWTAEAGKSEQAQGFKRPIESTADVGLSHSIGQIEKGLDMLRIDGVDGDDDLEAPSSFCCPITTEVLKDPVVAADGHTYERQHITEWLQKSDTSPMTNETMEHKHLTPNFALVGIMQAYFGVKK